MSLEDIKTEPIVIIFEEKELKLEFDNSSLALAEQSTKKSIFKLKDLMLKNDLTLEDSIKVFIAALAKHHDHLVMNEVSKKLSSALYLIEPYSSYVIAAFMQPILAPEVYNKVFKEEEKNPEKKQEKEPKK